MPDSYYEFVEFPAFTRQLEAAGDSQLLEAIQEELLRNPEAGSLLKGGIRKVRVKSAARSRGKRGGYRVWYFFYRRAESLLLLFLLDKRQADNISSRQERELVKALSEALRGI